MIAIAARIQGTVFLAATISRTGTIENLRVVSGPPMLAPAGRGGRAHVALSALLAEWASRSR